MSRALPLTFQEAQFVGVGGEVGSEVEESGGKKVAVEIRKQKAVDRAQRAQLVDVDDLLAAVQELKDNNRFWNDIHIRSKQEWEAQARAEDQAMYDAFCPSADGAAVPDEEKEAELTDSDYERADVNPIPNVILAHPPNVEPLEAERLNEAAEARTKTAQTRAPATNVEPSPTKSPVKKKTKGTAGAGKRTIIAHAEDNTPIPLFMDPYSEALAFPHLFPTGNNCFNSKRQQRISTADYFKSRLNHKDARWRQDLIYLFYAFYRLGSILSCLLTLRGKRDTIYAGLNTKG